MKIKETKICYKKNIYKNKNKEKKKRVEKNIGCSRGRVMTFDMYISIYAFYLLLLLLIFLKYVLLSGEEYKVELFKQEDGNLNIFYCFDIFLFV